MDAGETTFQVFYKLVAEVEGSIRRKEVVSYEYPVDFNLLMKGGEGMIETAEFVSDC